MKTWSVVVGIAAFTNTWLSGVNVGRFIDLHEPVSLVSAAISGAVSIFCFCVFANAWRVRGYGEALDSIKRGRFL
jgi:hypothetical protein